MTTAAEYNALADIAERAILSPRIYAALREAAKLAEEKHRVPTAALIEVWAALFGPARVDEFGTWFNKHGYEAAWGRLLGGIREKVSYADKLEARVREVGDGVMYGEIAERHIVRDLDAALAQPHDSESTNG